jgi:hypothetical protein
MSIQIIDGFQVNTALPIDNRIVASGSAARNAIPFKYEGLRVFDTSDRIPYVYLNNNWVSENASGILGSGSASRIPLYTLSNVVNNSWFYQSGFNISTVDAGTGTDKISMNARTGLLTAVSLSGNGSLVTNISGLNINNGSIEVNGSNSKLVNGSTGQVLLSGSSFTSWTNQSQLSVGTASNSTNSTNTRITRDSGNTVTQYLTFVSSGAWAGLGSGNEGIRSNHLDLTYVPSTRTLTVGTVSATGIRFSSLQQKSSDLNTLDDYEEGTWTPIITGSTGTFTYQSNGQYTKIGRLLHLSGVIRFNSVSSCSTTPLDNYINLSAVSAFESSVPTTSAAVGVWSSNPSTSTVNNRLFSSNVYSGAVIISNLVTGNSRMYFTHNGDNPLGGCLSDVVSFNITIHNTN